MIPDYTLVVGVDKRHLDQLELTSKTWWKHKPELLHHRMVVFYDVEQVTSREIHGRISHPDLSTFPWPYLGTCYDLKEEDRFSNPQRYKMLSGFVYVPIMANIQTPYWLKLDTDVVATGKSDWIDEKWFDEEPAIISHPWTFTKPPNQILDLDRWASLSCMFLPMLENTDPLDLKPEPGSDRVGHRRIISWCSFYRTEFTRLCTQAANFDGNFGLPVPSQDGFVWYMAKRIGLPIVRTQMKKRGWEQWHTDKNVRNAVERSLHG